MSNDTLTEKALERAQLIEAERGAPDAADDWLLQQLGQAVSDAAVQAAPEVARPLDTTTEGLDLAKRIGLRVLGRLEREVHKLLCGQSEDDKADRNALGLTSDALVSTVTLALTAGLSVGPQAAAFLAALIVRRLAAPGLEEACSIWGERLGTPD